jgi:hypothetical protein
MQPNPPNAPSSPSAAPKPRNSTGWGIMVGVIVLLAFIYLMDRASKGETAVFSGVDRHISAQDFHGAQCTAVFGSCKIDLRDAQIQGREAVVETYAVFGDIEIWVPKDWEVVNHGFAVFGGMGDQRRHSSGGGDTKTLIVQGAAVFGEVQIKN